jgi:hypothetical protein
LRLLSEFEFIAAAGAKPWGVRRDSAYIAKIVYVVEFSILDGLDFDDLQLVPIVEPRGQLELALAHSNIGKYRYHRIGWQELVELAVVTCKTESATGFRTTERRLNFAPRGI